MDIVQAILAQVCPASPLPSAVRRTRCCRPPSHTMPVTGQCPGQRSHDDVTDWYFHPRTGHRCVIRSRSPPRATIPWEVALPPWRVPMTPPEQVDLT
eukprot:9015503-Heterocapsa_arctica.AAC.1